MSEKRMVIAGELAFGGGLVEGRNRAEGIYSQTMGITVPLQHKNGGASALDPFHFSSYLRVSTGKAARVFEFTPNIGLSRIDKFVGWGGRGVGFHAGPVLKLDGSVMRNGDVASVGIFGGARWYFAGNTENTFSCSPNLSCTESLNYSFFTGPTTAIYSGSNYSTAWVLGVTYF